MSSATGPRYRSQRRPAGGVASALAMAAASAVRTAPTLPLASVAHVFGADPDVTALGAPAAPAAAAAFSVLAAAVLAGAEAGRGRPCAQKRAGRSVKMCTSRTSPITPARIHSTMR